MKNECPARSRDLQQIPHAKLSGDSNPPTNFTKRLKDVPFGDLRGQPPTEVPPDRLSGAHNARTTRLAAMVGRRGLPRGWRILAVADLTGEGDEVLLVVEGGTARDLCSSRVGSGDQGKSRLIWYPALGQCRDRRPFFHDSRFPEKRKSALRWDQLRKCELDLAA